MFTHKVNSKVTCMHTHTYYAGVGRSRCFGGPYCKHATAENTPVTESVRGIYGQDCKQTAKIDKEYLSKNGNLS